ncbi:MAG: YggS family pyridoxal phosphate-dependent enzyme [Cytophagaceae bacterium]|nr:MAG: YggS family pyridoxal phosphate-dependent enzyme [Cytophagaceae bacterium]
MKMTIRNLIVAPFCLLCSVQASAQTDHIKQQGCDMKPYQISIDSLKLLQEVNKQAAKHDRVIDCLLQIYIADEETKFGLSAEEAKTLLKAPELDDLPHVRIVGLMGLATNTEDEEQIRQEFRGLKRLYDQLAESQRHMIHFHELSMGMSGDYRIAVEEGSTMVRVGSAIFGSRV